MENTGHSFSDTGFSPNDDDNVVTFADEQSDTPQEQDDGDVVHDDQQAPPRKKKNANPFNKRIDRLTAEKGEAEQQATFWAQQTAERDRIIAAQQDELQQAKQQAQQSDKYANSYYESNLQTAESALIDKIEQAELEGDIRRKTELSRDLAKVVAQQSTYELYKSQKEQQQREQQYNEPYVPYETPVAEPYRRAAPVNEDFRDWQEENSWYGTDAGLTHEANVLSDELARTLRFNNQAHLIGTNEFRKTITDEMRKRYGSGGSTQTADDQQEHQQYSQSRAPAVAPVIRRGTSMADQYVNNRGGSRMAPLTKEEYNLAKYLPQKTKTESEADLMRRYAEAKKYPKSPHSGGTPYRLTIL